jgi:hypothetical protein
MTQATFFEIGGSIVELFVLENARHEETVFNPMPVGMSEEDFEQNPKAQMAAFLLKEAARADLLDEEYDELRALRAYNRARRAKWAVTTALALAAADGPLPIGDTIAIVGLGIYAVYEGTMAIGDVLQVNTW